MRQGVNESPGHWSDISFLLYQAFVKLAKERPSSVALARFLCGITTPALGIQQVKQLADFGTLEQYSFPEVKAWVDSSREG